MTNASRTKRIQKILTIPLLLALFFLVAQFNTRYHMANLGNVSVTSTNPRPSFRGLLGSGNTVGSSIVTLNGTPSVNVPSTSSAQLVEGDTVAIGQGASLGTYTVASTSSNTVFTTDSGITSATAGHDVISTQSANLTVRFTTANAVNNGKFRVLVPALANDANSGDGIPDGGYFDFGSGTGATVTCPASGGNYTFAAGTALKSAVSISGTDYHSFECGYTGAGAVGTSFSASPIVINGLINPAPKPGHTNGTADSYNVIVQHLDNGGTVVDQTAVSIAVIEAVRVTATVPPQLTFQVIGRPTGYSACGVTTKVGTTPTAVPFGEVSISSFTDAAQTLTASTNAVGGFVVTALENDQLGRNGAVCTGDPTITSNLNCIADTRGDGGTASDTVQDNWVSSATKGFGFSLHDQNSSTTEAFAYNSGGAFMARQFADVENSGTAQTIFSSTAPADNHNVDVCYRIVVGSTTAAGNYENNVIYNATATF
jgi:hypothetical protein